jgi:hypothetical protein
MNIQLTTLQAWDLAVGGVDQNENPTIDHQFLAVHYENVITTDENEGVVDS